MPSAPRSSVTAPAPAAGRRARATSRPATRPARTRTAARESHALTWLFSIMVILILLLLVRPMMMSVLSYHRTAGLLAERRVEVAALSTRNAHLRETRQWYRSDAFLAERAREYGLVRPGETPFVVRELVHPELVGAYAATQLQNATGARPLNPADSATANRDAASVTTGRTPQP